MKSRRRFDRSAFTLLELVLVLGILGTLAGFLLSAVQRVREVANRAACANNLKQIGLAGFAYQLSYRQLPPACLMPYAQPGTTPSITDASGVPPPEMIDDNPTRKDSDPNQPFGPGWSVYLLPYLGQENLFRQANISDYLAGYNSGNTAQRDRWRSVVQNQSLSIYLCPSDRGPGIPFAGYQNAPGPWARGNYAANAGPGWWQMSYKGGSYTEAFGRTGPVMGINFGIFIPEISDGASNTVFFNEVRIGVNELDSRGVWAMPFPGSSVTAANAIGDCITPNDATEGSDDVLGCPKYWYAGIGYRDHIGCSTGYYNLGWFSWQAQARSRHAGGVNVCFADGSVRFVSNYVDQATWFYMLSTEDGVAYCYDW